ncbi:PucR family transcriptional regulator [Dactylosporangium sp. AC04546]|uniref:PucR family transcriptional regulator n=1 Tax=Dactylosporangium sp. AC04546 TaxID=2862460 RepID=UPI001EDD56A8|nr:PucR family transcriptional regulator [Dactylosporangium sp. AC04546]WVK88319.1 PucR family transcriptional regulator [Dactylosporangium sp. AC04546]
MPWNKPSPRVRELIRQGAEIALNPPAHWLAELDEATLTGQARQQIAADPVLAAGTRRTNRSNLLFWAAANVRAPGERVPANDTEEPLSVARDLIRRGLDESALDAYRAGESVAVRLWTQIACSLTADPEELRELLDVSLRSIAAFVDDTVTAISARMRAERDELTRGTHAERRETVTLLLDGAPITRERAEHRLGYGLQSTHTAAIVWTDDPDADLRQLDRAADALAEAAARARPLSILASAATRWVWVHGQPDMNHLRTALDSLPAVRIALGPTATGVDGFRRSHLDALTTQQMLARLTSASRLASHDEIELVALLTADPERADRFVKRTLGGLETAPPELLETLRVFIAEQCNASRAAERLFTHRNTLLRRLARAERLLPRPLPQHTVEVGAALEVLRWRGHQ